MTNDRKRQKKLEQKRKRREKKRSEIRKRFEGPISAPLLVRRAAAMRPMSETLLDFANVLEDPGFDDRTLKAHLMFYASAWNVAVLCQHDMAKAHESGADPEAAFEALFQQVLTGAPGDNPGVPDELRASFREMVEEKLEFFAEDLRIIGDVVLTKNADGSPFVIATSIMR